MGFVELEKAGKRMFEQFSPVYQKNCKKSISIS